MLHMGKREHSLSFIRSPFQDVFFSTWKQTVPFKSWFIDADTMYQHTKHRLSKKIKRKIAIIFLSIGLKMCFGCSKAPSHRDCSFEYLQHKIGLRYKQNKFQLALLSGGLTKDIRSFLLIVFLNSELYFAVSYFLPPMAPNKNSRRK